MNPKRFTTVTAAPGRNHLLPVPFPEEILIMRGVRDVLPETMDPVRGERPAEPPRLEMFVRCVAPDESLLEVRGLSPTWFADLFAAEIRPLDVLLSTAGPSSGPAPLPPEGIERMTGEGFLSRALRWDEPGRFVWAGLRGLPAEPPASLLEAACADLEDLKVSLPDEVFLFEARDGTSRIIFTWREHLHRAVGALIHRHVTSLAGPPPLTPPNHRFCEDLVRRVDGMGFATAAGPDFTDKRRTIEVRLHPVPPGGSEATGPGGPWILYYDRTTGLWAVAG